MGGIIQPEELGLVALLFPDGVDDEAPARREMLQRLHNGFPGRRRVDDGLELLRRRLLGRPGPGGPQLAREGPLPFAPGEDEDLCPGKPVADR